MFAVPSGTSWRAGRLGSVSSVTGWETLLKQAVGIVVTLACLQLAILFRESTIAIAGYSRGCRPVKCSPVLFWIGTLTIQCGFANAANAMPCSAFVINILEKEKKENADWSNATVYAL